MGEAAVSAGRDQLRLLATGALYLVSTAALLRAVAMFVDNPMPAAVIGAAAVSLIAARADVRTERFVARARKRMAWGAVVSLAAAVLIVGMARATGGSVEVSGVSAAAFYGLAEAVGLGYAREMWLRGIPLTFAQRAGIPVRYAYWFAAMAGVATVLLEPGATVDGVVLTAASSALFTAMWIRGGDGHAAITAHVLWVWLTDAALGGEVFMVSIDGAKLTTLPDARGTVIYVVSAFFAVATVAVLLDWIPLRKLYAREFPEPDHAPRPPKKKRKSKGRR